MGNITYILQMRRQRFREVNSQHLWWELRLKPVCVSTFMRWPGSTPVICNTVSWSHSDSPELPQRKGRQNFWWGNAPGAPPWHQFKQLSKNIEPHWSIYPILTWTFPNPKPAVRGCYGSSTSTHFIHSFIPWTNIHVNSCVCLAGKLKLSKTYGWDFFSCFLS